MMKIYYYRKIFMFFKKKYFIIIFFYFLNFLTYSNEEALNDLIFIEKTLKEDHPGFLFDENFSSKFLEIRNKALLGIKKSKTNKDRLEIINYFLQDMKCTHLRVFLNEKKEEESLIKKIIKNIKNFFNTFYENKKEKNEFLLKKINNFKNTFYIKLPNFFPNNKEIEKINNLCFEIKKNKNNIKNLIFDIRGNGGGDTRYCSKILESIFGNDYFNFNYAEKNKNLYCLWRASEDNFNYIKNLFEKIKKEDPNFIDFSNKFLNEFNEAIKNKKKFYKFIENKWYLNFLEKNKSFSIENLEKNFNKNIKIFILIDNFVSSAALDFIDYLYCMNVPIKLIGLKTNFDSIYMDTRSVELPSKLGFLIFPQKVYVNRIRGNNESYFPDLEINLKSYEIDFIINNFLKKEF